MLLVLSWIRLSTYQDDNYIDTHIECKIITSKTSLTFVESHIERLSYPKIPKELGKSAREKNQVVHQPKLANASSIEPRCYGGNHGLLAILL